MYICACNGITESEVRDLARQFPDESVEQLYARLDVQVDCGTCVTFAQDLVVKARRADISRPPSYASGAIDASA